MIESRKMIKTQGKQSKSTQNIKEVEENTSPKPKIFRFRERNLASNHLQVYEFVILPFFFFFYVLYFLSFFNFFWLRYTLVMLMQEKGSSSSFWSFNVKL